MGVEKSWENTCRVLFGQEIGPMEKYAAYLGRYSRALRKGKSAISGKEVSVSAPQVPECARLIGNAELPLYAQAWKGKPLGIDEVKDLDSLSSALRERFAYAGGIVLGNSAEVAGSDRVFNSCFVRNSAEIYDSKFVAYSSTARFAEYIYGCDNVGQGSKFCIKGHDIYEAVRCFEAVRVFSSADCHYGANLEGCSNCMFSFNLRKTSYAIGNLPLPKDKYVWLRAKLTGEIRETLMKEGKAPTIFEIMGGAS